VLHEIDYVIALLGKGEPPRAALKRILTILKVMVSLDILKP
jgi:hypothetical protein